MGKLPDPSFGAVYETEADQVFRTVFLLCRNEEVARDATQEAFARALERWERLQGHEWVGGWLTRTALNAAKRSLRSRSPIETPSSHEPETADVELWEIVRLLPDKQRTAVILRYRLGLDTSLIAEAMGLQEGTVRTHLARATNSLREQLSDEEVDDGIR